MHSTESQNPQSTNLDQLTSLEYVQLHIEEEQAVMQALNNADQQIAQAIDLIYESFAGVDLDQEPYQGARLFYVGAGTSGRLGVLDASECPPTFSTHPDMVQGLIAGGDFALRNAVEGAEDDEIAEEMGVSLDELFNTLNETKSMPILSLEDMGIAKESGEPQSLLDCLAGKGDADPQTHHRLVELKEIIAKAIDTLPEKERLMISLYYYEELTMKEIGEVLGITESRVSQIHSKAVFRLRNKLKSIIAEEM